MTGVDPHIENVDSWVSLGVRRTVPMAELSTVFGPTFEAVAAAAGQAGAAVVGPAYSEYFSVPTDTVDVEIGFGVDHLVEVPGMNAKQRPATRAVIGTHVGPYDKLSESYTELMGWLEQQDVELTDSMFEFYDSEPDVDPNAAVTRLVFPLA
ncbi:MAG: GyrI-like domain-containing protein [Micropruina sp.]|nr:GyrI-like domain-containing protein [Micropruina sp.]